MYVWMFVMLLAIVWVVYNLASSCLRKRGPENETLVGPILLRTAITLEQHR
jgi:hypothetical protein